MIPILFIPVIGSFSFAFGWSYLIFYKKQKQMLSEALPLSADNAIIVFDLHCVLFHHDYKGMLQIFLHSPLKWKLLRTLTNPRLIYDIVHLLYQRPIPESFFMYLANHYKDIEETLPLFIKIANKQIPNEQTIAIARSLKEQGYQLAVLSNIGQRIFEDFKKDHVELFQLFDNIIVSTPETNYISKPNPKVYKRLRDELQSSKHLVLIDDKLKNIKGGLRSGIIGIRYKNAQRLKKQLKKLAVEV